MKKALSITLLCLLFVTARANDGVFYAQGNQLIPITETDIRVTKEHLSLKRVGNYIEVSVYYEFFNPTTDKRLLVGFEAAPPYPYEMSYPNHPEIHDFTVEMNGTQQPYQVSVVNYYDSDTVKGLPPYYRNGAFAQLSKQEMDTTEWWDWAPIYYVYHFDAHFKHGLNVVRHTYRYRASNSVMYTYECPYVLTAANRWANHQIDDFTLDIDMGQAQSFMMTRSFFKELKEWQIVGNGRANLVKNYITYDEDSAAFFHIREGMIRFHATNFHPNGELWLGRPIFFMIQLMSQCESKKELFDALKTQYIYPVMGWSEDDEPYAEYLSRMSEDVHLVLSDFDKKIIKNIPFAQRGYVFKNKELQRFFESTDWYVPNPDYQADMTDFSAATKHWVEYWSK